MQPKNEKETRGKREVERRCVPLPTSAVPTRGRHLKEMDHMQRKGEMPRGTKDKGDDRQAPNLNNTRNEESREEKAPKGRGDEPRRATSYTKDKGTYPIRHCCMGYVRA